jgi:hypothetical protein
MLFISLSAALFENHLKTKLKKFTIKGCQASNKCSSRLYEANITLINYKLNYMMSPRKLSELSSIINSGHPITRTFSFLFFSFFFFFKTGSHYVAQAGLELEILPQLSECWEYCHEPPSLTSLRHMSFALME